MPSVDNHEALLSKSMIEPTRLDGSAGLRCLGFLESQISIPEDFDRMGEAEIAKLFEG